MAQRKTKSAADWQSVNADILAKLDMQAEFAALGIDITGQPKESGWVECRAVGRGDNTPSAAVNVHSGRYRDLGGDGLSLSFYDLAVHVKQFARWQDARDHFAAKAGVEIGVNGDTPRDPAKHLCFMPWSDSLVALWCRQKPGVTPEAVRANGGRLARYRDQYTVVCLPVFGPKFTAMDPVGWVLWNITGGDLPIFHGKDKKTGQFATPTWAKMKTTGGSEGGLIGQWAIDRLTADDADPASQLIWKVEGPSDLLTLWSSIPPDEREQYLVITNSGGATERPAGWMQPLFAGRRVGVVGDADIPGQKGAVLWAAWCCKVASETRIKRDSQFSFKDDPQHDSD